MQIIDSQLRGPAPNLLRHKVSEQAKENGLVAELSLTYLDALGIHGALLFPNHVAAAAAAAAQFPNRLAYVPFVTMCEEEKANSARLAHARVWIVDLVDGTREYGEHRANWAVHVGLAIDGNPGVGAAALPELNLVLRTDRVQPLAAVPQRMLVSRTHPAKEALVVADALGAERVPMGLAGAKAMAVIRGEADIYLHSGGQYEWDSCAPVAVALAHGLHCSRIDGSPLRYNRQDPCRPDLLNCRAGMAARMLRVIECDR